MAVKLFAVLTLVLWVAALLAGVVTLAAHGHGWVLILGVLVSCVLAVLALFGP